MTLPVEDPHEATVTFEETLHAMHALIGQRCTVTVRTMNRSREAVWIDGVLASGETIYDPTLKVLASEGSVLFTLTGEEGGRAYGIVALHRDLFHDAAVIPERSVTIYMGDRADDLEDDMLVIDVRRS